MASLKQQINLDNVIQTLSLCSHLVRVKIIHNGNIKDDSTVDAHFFDSFSGYNILVVDNIIYIKNHNDWSLSFSQKDEKEKFLLTQLRKHYMLDSKTNLEDFL
jgi:hypothetical protein